MKLLKSDIICQCNEVTRGEIKHAVFKRGANTLLLVQRACGAGTRCGRCIPLIDEIIYTTKINTKESDDKQLSIDF